MKTIQLNIVFNNVMQKLSFEDIEKMIKGNSAFRKFHCYCVYGILRAKNDADDFAKDFFNIYHPDHSEKSFKLILEMGTTKLIEIKNN